MATQRQARPAKISTAPLFLFLGLVALLGAILGLVGRINKKKIEEAEIATEQRAIEQEEKAAVNPFADLPQEVALGDGSRGSRWATAFPRDANPTGLEAEEIWQLALDQVDAAWVLFDHARKALAAEDEGRFDSKGREARLAFQKALDGTSDWETQIIAAHGDRDPQVRKIIRTRDEWDEQVQYLRKTARR